MNAPDAPPVVCSEAEFLSLLQDLGTGDNAIRNQAEKNFEALKAKHKSTENDAGEDGQGFAGFVKLKRENAVLREQIKDLMQTQRRILTSAKRVAPRPGRGRRR